MNAATLLGQRLNYFHDLQRNHASPDVIVAVVILPPVLLFVVPSAGKLVCSLAEKKLQAKTTRLGCPVIWSREKDVKDGLCGGAGGITFDPWIHLKILKSWSISESPGNSGLLTKQGILRRQSIKTLMIIFLIIIIIIIIIMIVIVVIIITLSTSLRQCSQGSKCQRCKSKTSTQAEFQEPCNHVL